MNYLQYMFWAYHRPTRDAQLLLINHEKYKHEYVINCQKNFKIILIIKPNYSKKLKGNQNTFWFVFWLLFIYSNFKLKLSYDLWEYIFKISIHLHHLSICSQIQTILKFIMAPPIYNFFGMPILVLGDAFNVFF